MNAYEKSQQLGLTGTDEQIVGVLKALSVSNVTAAKARIWLSDHQLLAYDGAAWFGSLQDNLSSLPLELQAGIRDLKSRVLSGDPIRSADKLWAPKVLAIITGIAAAMPSIAGLVDSFYDLDGGRLFKDLTVGEFQAQRAERESAAAEQAAEELRQQTRHEFLRDRYNPAYNTHVAPLLDGSAPLTAEAMASALEAMATVIRGE